MLEVQALSCQVLHRVTLHVASGEVVAVLGAAGAGKTTLLRALSGLDPCCSGQVRFAGSDLQGVDHAGIVRAGLLHVPQGGRLFQGLTARDNLLLGATVRGRMQRQATLAQVLEVMPLLRDRLHRRAGTLDGLSRQVLAIGRALMARPSLLMLDDPVATLATDDAESVLQLIAWLGATGLPILLAARPDPGAAALANRRYILEQGRATLEGAR